MEKRWKFLRLSDKGVIKSNSGTTKWKVGQTHTHRGTVKLCESGFHCSKGVYQAFSYVQGEVLALVECSGKHDDQEDKEAWQTMKIVKAYRWQKKDSVALAIYAAELVIENFEKEFPNDSRPRDAIKAAKKYLRYPTEENQAAAWSAAWSAWSAARSAAWSAWSAAWSAWSAARSAAWSAARSAAESAARSAAWSAESAESAAIEKIAVWMDKRVSKLEELL